MSIEFDLDKSEPVGAVPHCCTPCPHDSYILNVFAFVGTASRGCPL